MRSLKNLTSISVGHRKIKDCFYEVLTWRRRLVGGPIFVNIFMNPTPPDFLYMWVGLSLFTLEYGGQAAYMEAHPK